MHSDLVNPLLKASLHGSKYFVVYTNDYPHKVRYISWKHRSSRGGLTKEKSFYQVTSTIYVKGKESNDNSFKQPLHKWRSKKEKSDNHWKNKKHGCQTQDSKLLMYTSCQIQDSKLLMYTSCQIQDSKLLMYSSCQKQDSKLPIIWLIEDQHRQITGSL
jgi:hypothetical protein